MYLLTLTFQNVASKLFLQHIMLLLGVFVNGTVRISLFHSILLYYVHNWTMTMTLQVVNYYIIQD